MYGTLALLVIHCILLEILYRARKIIWGRGPKFDAEPLVNDSGISKEEK